MGKDGLQYSVWRDLKNLRVSNERSEAVVKIISEGSDPHLGFYALISAASVIASIGLLTNSDPVVIGAMLVSPLMTPIFGIALGMVRGESSLFLTALRAEAGGVTLAIVFGVLFGALQLSSETTPAISSRLSPNLLDLLVAVFAGMAGTWALIDERISPVLPGVAISTAIIPPLSVCGLCLARGAYAGAQGAFLLFFANFLAILMVSSLIFLWVGFASGSMAPKRRQLLPRIVVTVAGFLILAAFLTHSLINVVKSHRRAKAAETVFLENQDKRPTFTLMDLRHQDFDGKVLMVAKVLTPEAFSPERVSYLEKQIHERIGHPVNLLIRCVLSRDVTSKSFFDQWVQEGLDGIELRKNMNPDTHRVLVAERILRDVCAVDPEVTLRDVDLIHDAERPVILAEVYATRRIVSEEVRSIQQKIRKQLNDSKMYLMVRNIQAIDTTSQGRLLFGEHRFGPFSKSEEEIVQWTRNALKKHVGLVVDSLVPVLRSNQWELYLEIVGDRVLTKQELKVVEREVSAKSKKTIKIFAWSKAEWVVTESAEQSMESFLTQELNRTKRLLK